MRAILREILRAWHYQVVEEGPFDLLLVDREANLPAPPGPHLLLGPGGTLGLPLSLDALWRELESRFHTPPRRYIRLELPREIEVRHGGSGDFCNLASLSSLGARFEYPREVLRGERMELDLQIAGEWLSLGSEVIYCIPHGEWLDKPLIHVGVVFDRKDRVQDKVGAFIVRTYLDQVRDVLGAGLFAEGEAFFENPLPTG